MIGSTCKREDALLTSEDSTKLNTSFIERLNLTIRRGHSYLARKTTGHARVRRALAEQLELFRCYYNFIRPHSSLRFGCEIRTPAMQAGLAKRKLRFRDVFNFTAGQVLFALGESRSSGSDWGLRPIKCAA